MLSDFNMSVKHPRKYLSEAQGVPTKGNILVKYSDLHRAC